MSTIKTVIYPAVAALSVSAAGKTPSVYALENSPNTLWTANVPCRLLLPVASQSKSRSLNYLTLSGTTRTVVWQITDLMLWQAQAQGRGLDQVSGALVEYAAAYIAAVSGKQAFAARTTLEDVTLEPGIFNYPLRSELWWYGVEVVLTLKEIID